MAHGQNDAPMKDDNVADHRPDCLHGRPTAAAGVMLCLESDRTSPACTCEGVRDAGQRRRRKLQRGSRCSTRPEGRTPQMARSRDQPALQRCFGDEPSITSTAQRVKPSGILRGGLAISRRPSIEDSNSRSPPWFLKFMVRAPPAPDRAHVPKSARRPGRKLYMAFLETIQR